MGDPGDLREWVDVIILALDGAWRSGATVQEIISAIVAKQTKNEGRTWPHWSTMPADKAIEHDRSGESHIGDANKMVDAAPDAVAYNSGGIELTACQLHEALLMAGYPELDVEFEDRSRVRIFQTNNGHSGPGLYCECMDVEEEGCILLDGTSPAIAAPVTAAPVEGGQIAGWRKVDGIAVFTVKSHSSITPDQEFVRYDDHLAALGSTPAAPGIDHAEMVKSNLRSIKRLATALPISHVAAANIMDEANHAVALFDASPKGGGDAEPMFYIQDTRSFVGNCPLWLAPNGAGYVTRLDEAGRFTEQEAIQQNRSRDSDVPWPCAEIDKLGRVTVDVQHMRPNKERLAELQITSHAARVSK